MTISFCTTCHNRGAQLAQTFDANVAAISDHPEAQWIILNFASHDGLHDFVMSKLPGVSDRVCYAQLSAPATWHVCVAKNVAHRLGAGDVLVNLDCDNFIGGCIPVVRSYFGRGAQVLHLWSGAHRDGTYGRIAIARDLFHRLGGYDETFYPIGYQDGDLLRRAAEMGFPILHHRCAAASAIPNTKEESIRHCPIDNLTWEDFDQLNRAKSAANIARRELSANRAGPWGRLETRVVRGARSSLWPNSNDEKCPMHERDPNHET